MLHFNTSAYLRNLQEAAQPRFDYRAASSSGDWQSWRRDFRAALESALGLPAIRSATQGLPLAPRVEEQVDCQSYIREKIYIATEPGIEIPFYLLLPKSLSNESGGPVPLVLTPHGHGRRGKEVYAGIYEDEHEARESREGERDIAVQAVSEGYAVIAPDVRGFWEMGRREEWEKQANNSCADLQKVAMLFGRTLIGERVHDMGRLLEYAATRPEVDASRVVITGNSGGGTVSLFTAALDERITLAVPGSYFCTFFDSLVSIAHCPCNVVPGIMNLGEMYDVAGLIAPRPVLMVNGQSDPIFPIEATRRAYAHLQNIYAAQGAAQKCELFIGSGGHRYYKARVWSFVRENL